MGLSRVTLIIWWIQIIYHQKKRKSFTFCNLLDHHFHFFNFNIRFSFVFFNKAAVYIQVTFLIFLYFSFNSSFSLYVFSGLCLHLHNYMHSQAIHSQYDEIIHDFFAILCTLSVWTTFNLSLISDISSII